MNLEKLQNLVIDACDLLDARYKLNDDVFELEVDIDDERAQLLSVYLSSDEFDYDKINFLVEIGPIIKNTELLYTFLKNNFEMDYGSYAIINDDDTDLLVICDSTPLDTCSADELASVVRYIAEKADETEERLSKVK